MFLDAVDASELLGEWVSSDYIYGHIKQVLDYVGAEHVVQVVTDNNSSCIRMGRLLMSEYPHIQWTPCAAHSLDLVVKDVAKLSWISDILAKAKEIVNFITTKRTVLAMYRSYKNLDIMGFSKTRFGYLFLVFERLLKVHSTLQQLVVSDSWRQWSGSRTQEAMRVKSIILSDDHYWKLMEDIVFDFRPIYNIIRLTDQEGCTMGLLYTFMTNLSRVIDNATRLERSHIIQVQNILAARWEWFKRPVHAVAYILHPLWRTEGGNISPELQEGWISYIEKHCDGPIQRNEIEDELLLFLCKRGPFSRPESLLRDAMLKPVSWWAKYG